MLSNLDSLKKELEVLTARGLLLYYAMLKEQGKLAETDEALKKKKIVLPNFYEEYEVWYSEALAVVKRLLPDRVDDFIAQYKAPKRKEVDYHTYTLSDYLLGLKTTRGGGSIIIADQTAAIPKMRNQNAILESVKKRFESSLFDLKEVVQADIYDSELAAALDLIKRGFYRAAGAIAGVVLEGHLAHVMASHKLKSRKKNLSIGDCNQMLKDNDLIDTPKWRFIQHLADLRNLCDHKKQRDPTQDDANDLVAGVDKVIKTVA